MLPGIDEALRFRNLPDLGLGQLSQREQGVGQLLLGERIEDIALVLRPIHGLFQLPAAIGRLADPGIVAGGDEIAAQFPGPAVQPTEFQVAVAVDAGIGSASLLIGVHEAADDVF